VTSVELTLFISHSSADTSLAKSLVELFEKSLKVPARQVRCSSVDGFRLPVDADTNEQLRREVFAARAFLGVVTPSGVQSAYVLFELGSRWGAKKHLAPVIAGADDASLLKGPLSSLNALHLDRREEVLQLVQDIAEYLTVNLEPLASFQSAVDSVVTQAKHVLVTASADRAAAEFELVFRNNAYWRESDGRSDGPFCQRCWDAERKLIRLTTRSDMLPKCANCGNYFELSPTRHEPRW